jgi:hypothetical protein
MRHSRRRPDVGAVLVVVLLAMIGLLGLGLTGLYLTSGSIQMSSNINMRNQALYVAEAGLQTAKSVLNRTVPGFAIWKPDLTSMLNGGGPSTASVPLPDGLDDKNLRPSDGNGCLGVRDDGDPTPGAYLRDDPGVGGCRKDTSAYINCAYPPASSGFTRGAATPDNTQPTTAQFMGSYTLFIRQDLAECRKKLAKDDGSIRDDNGIVVIRSEGTASDNRTKVVLEVTMSPNPNPPIAKTGVASVCPAGAAGCDDNASVQQGITVSGILHGSGGAPGAGGAGAGGAPGAGGTTASSSTAGPSLGGSASGGTGGGAGGAGGSSCTSKSDCPSGQVCCGGTCVTPNAPDTHDKCGPCATQCSDAQTCCSGVCTDMNSDHDNCGQCGVACKHGRICCVGVCEADPGCPSIATIGITGPWDNNYRNQPGQGAAQFRTWLARHSSGCGGKPLTIFDSDNPSNPATLLTASRLAPYQVIILLDVKHNDADLQLMISNPNQYNASCTVDYCGVGAPGYDGTHGNMRALSDDEAAALSDWVKQGGGLMTIVGLENDQYEPSFANKVLQDSGIQYSTVNTSILGGVTVIQGEWGGTSNGLFGFKRDALPPTGLAAALTYHVGALRASHGYEITPVDSDVATLSSYARGYARTRDITTGNYSANKEYRTVGVAGTMGSGRVNVWGDEWVTYDTVWGDPTTGKSIDGHTYDADQYWNNVIKWLGRCN